MVDHNVNHGKVITSDESHLRVEETQLKTQISKDEAQLDKDLAAHNNLKAISETVHIDQEKRELASIEHQLGDDKVKPEN